MRRVNEADLRKSLLKVISPYEGSAFMVGPDLALSCIHVCVPDEASSGSRHKVELEYQPGPKAAPVYLHGEYLPDQSDPDHDLAVIRVELPAGLRIPPVPLSCDDQQREKVVAFGFPNQQPALHRVPGVIHFINYMDPVCFEPDDWTCPVLHIDTRGQKLWSDQVVRPGMSGGPIWNERTGTVVAVIEGRKPRGSTPGDMPEGYGIPVKHLYACSTKVQPLLQRSSRVRWRQSLLIAVSVGLGVLAFGLYQLISGAKQFPGVAPVASVKDGSKAGKTPPPHTAPLELRIVTMKRRGNTVSALKDGDIMTSEDHYGFFLQPAQETFVYVLQQDAAGTINVLFPDSKWTPQTNPLPAGKPTWLPMDINHWFYLDNNTGQEVIMVVATRERNKQLEAMLNSLEGGESHGALAAWLLAPDRGLGGVKQFESQPLFFPDGQTLNLETALVQGSGIDFVYKVEFQHKE